MNKLIIFLTFISLLGCSANKNIQMEQTTMVNDSTSINKIDSTSIQNFKNEEVKIDETVETVINEVITESVKDTTNNVVIDRVINRQIKQTAGKAVSSNINEQSDTTYINKEKTLETKDNKAIQQYNENKKESNKIKYIFGIVLLVLIGYVIYKFKK